MKVCEAVLINERENKEDQKDDGMTPEEFPVVRHRRPMVTLDKVFDDQGLLDFEKGVRAAVGDGFPFQYTVEPKINGISVAMGYEKGRLVTAVTRGDGYLGELVTPNIKTILSVPLTLEGSAEGRPVPDLMEVWGKVYMEIQLFEALNRDRRGRGWPPFPSPKVAASDSLRQLNPRETAKRPLNLFCYGVGVMSGPSWGSHYELMIHLQKWGLRVNRPLLRVCETIGEVIEQCHQLFEVRPQFPYEVDGVVVRVNQLNLPRGLREASESPQWAVAYELRPTGQGAQ